MSDAMIAAPTRAPAPAKPRTRRPPRSETRKLVIDGAIAAFVERGFMGASVNFICSKAGLSRGAFYSNFGDKDELFAALYERRAEKLRTRLMGGVAELDLADDVFEQLRVVLAELDADEVDWDIINKEFAIHALRNDSARRLLVELRAALRNDLAQVITTVLVVLGKTPPADMDDLTRLAVAIHEGDMTQRGLEPAERAGRSLLSEYFVRILKAL